MFTGIIEEIGIVRECSSNHIVIEANKVLDDMYLGDSISVNGACLTVTMMTDRSLSVDIMSESIKRTTLGMLNNGDKVNLERAMSVKGRIGGHLVLGHVDSVGSVTEMAVRTTETLMSIDCERELMRFIAEKGFIAVDGVSLTITGLRSSSFDVSLVSYTLQNSTLGSRKRADSVNLEIDVIARYLDRLNAAETDRGVTLELFQEYGYIKKG